MKKMIYYGIMVLKRKGRYSFLLIMYSHPSEKLSGLFKEENLVPHSNIDAHLVRAS